MTIDLMNFDRQQVCAVSEQGGINAKLMDLGLAGASDGDLGERIGTNGALRQVVAHYLLAVEVDHNGVIADQMQDKPLLRGHLAEVDFKLMPKIVSGLSSSHGRVLSPVAEPKRTRASVPARIVELDLVP